MTRELIFASVVSAIWLATCLVCTAVLYVSLGRLLDPSGLMQFEHAWGTLHYSHGVSISRLSLFVIGTGMFLACLPINYYWMRRCAGTKAV